VGVEQCLLAPAECCGAVRVDLFSGQFDLDADELGAKRIAVFIEPVGVDEAWGVVLRRVDDGAEEGVRGYCRGSG
jgi:hypothetical protein